MFSFKKLGAVSLLALGLGLTPVYAQNSTAPSSSSTNEQDLQKALSANFPAKHLELASNVLKASGLLVMFENSIPNVIGSLRVNVTRMRPELAKDIEECLKIAEAELPKITQDGINAAARFMAIDMSEAELQEVLTFLSSATGKKYVATLPRFMDKVVPFVEIWSQEVGARITSIFQEEMVKRGHKI